MAQEEVDFKSLYIQILRDIGIKGEFTQVSIKSPELDGDNFCSICHYVTVERENEEPIELFVKRLINNPEYTKMLRELKVFDKEAGYFNEILPELERVVRSRIGEEDTEYDLNFGPKCYFANMDTIVMENLTKRGYILLDKVQLQGLNEAKMVVENLARFHAPSYVLLAEGGNDKTMSKFPCLEDSFLMKGSEEMLGEWLIPCMDIIIQIVQTYPRKDRDLNLKTLFELSQNLIKKVQDYFRMADEDVAHVINHGDCWNNNMMFLRDPETNKLIHQTFVDFQGIRVGSPNLDIGYYFFTSLKHHVRREEWKNLLQLYYDSLVKNVTNLKGEVSFSFEEFLADYKIKFVSGFIFGLCMGGMMDALKDVGVGNLEEVKGDLIVHLHGIVQNWIANNPEKVKQKSEDIADLLKEYRHILSL